MAFLSKCHPLSDYDDGDTSSSLNRAHFRTLKSPVLSIPYCRNSEIFSVCFAKRPLNILGLVHLPCFYFTCQVCFYIRLDINNPTQHKRKHSIIKRLVLWKYRHLLPPFARWCVQYFVVVHQMIPLCSASDPPFFLISYYYFMLLIPKSLVLFTSVCLLGYRVRN